MTIADPVRQIAQAVLYEGYLLWPYRRSALKNQHRFTIGGIYPPAYAGRFLDRSRASFCALIEGHAPSLDLELRFLRIVRRQVVRDGAPVDAAQVGEERHLSWEEATEESIVVHNCTPHADVPIVLDAGRREERLDERTVLVRSWERMRGSVCINATPIAPERQSVTVDVVNECAWSGTTREDALRWTFASAHVVLRVREGAFVSTIDPPGDWRDAAAQCESDGLWPGLVGVPGARDTLLASPVIVGDYPQVAPESHGDYFDGGEVDELLVHSIRALTDDEQREMRDTDPRTREILERTLRLRPAEIARLHGAVRDERTVET